MYLDEFLFDFEKFTHKMHLLFEIRRLRMFLKHSTVRNQHQNTPQTSWYSDFSVTSWYSDFSRFCLQTSLRQSVLNSFYFSHMRFKPSAIAFSRRVDAIYGQTFENRSSSHWERVLSLQWKNKFWAWSRLWPDPPPGRHPASHGPGFWQWVPDLGSQMC